MAKRTSRSAGAVSEGEQDSPTIVNLSAEDLETLSIALGIPDMLATIEDQRQEIERLKLAHSDLAVYANRLHEMYQMSIGEPLVRAKIEGSFANGSFRIIRDRTHELPASLSDPTKIGKKNNDPVLNMVVE